jgi:hypothetical protein
VDGDERHGCGGSFCCEAPVVTQAVRPVVTPAVTG